MSAHHKVAWVDSGAEPKNKPNWRYPLGIDLDMSKGSDRTCLVELAYPAKRIGYYSIECRYCGLRVAVSTAGRPDDPRSVKLGCKAKD
jgi:DNA-directed RNA polymerase subunit RPC12/RpoP